MAGLNKVEEFLIDLGVSYADPIVMMYAQVMPVPATRREEFFALLLKLNYEGLVHGAFALKGEEIVLVDSLEYDGMDRAEFEASLDAVGYALAEHYPALSKFKGN